MATPMLSSPSARLIRILVGVNLALGLLNIGVAMLGSML